MNIDYNNPTDNEIRRIVAEACDATAQIYIIHDLTGKSVDEIREICGMPAAKKKKRGYGRGRPKRWTMEKIQYLYDHPNEKCQDIAKKLDMSASSVTSMRYQLGIKQISVWTDDLIEKLTIAYRNGLRASQIAKLLDMDLYAVQKKIIAMRACKKL